MGQNEKRSWHDGNRELNIRNHGLDFADLEEVFDGRFVVARLSDRFDYGEARYNVLAEFRGGAINIALTPRAERYRLISARLASRDERMVYYDRKAR